MIDKEFCSFLEYKLCHAFSNSVDLKIKGYCCDGILLPYSDNEISKKYVDDRHEIVMTTFIGFDGQDRYTLILKFGNKSLSRYARGLAIKECIPSVSENEWYDIDTLNRFITIRLL